MSRITRHLLAGAVALAAGFTSLPAPAQHLNTARGYGADRTFFGGGGVDQVNLFNGNLVIDIPLGAPFRAGGDLTYGLNLAYNSNPWDFQERLNGTYIQSLPNRRSNAGLGWVVSLGRLYGPTSAGNDTRRWLYSSSDGADHLFFNTLHEGDTDDPGDTGSNQTVLYTRDGSYLRLKRNVVTGFHEIEASSGQIHRFRSSDNLLTQIRDRFGNKVDVAYLANRWELTDTFGRVQRVYFRSDLPTITSVVDRVELTAFNGAVATYSFGYTTVSLPRACHDNDPQTGNLNVPLLTRLTLPSGAFYDLPTTSYHLTATGVCSPGLLKSLLLPTRGRVDWTWMTYNFPDASGRVWVQSTDGVASRKLTAADGTTVVGTWTYATQIEPVTERELKNTVTDPLGHKTEYFFSVATAELGTWNTTDYGLPFTRNVTDATGTRFLSRRVYDGGSTLVRSVYLRYERDRRGTTALFSDASLRNRRVASARTVYHDDGDRFADVTYSRFDGLGNYREMLAGGNFGAGDVRTEKTEFNPARGVYLIDPNTDQPAGGHTFTMWPAANPWVLGTFTEKVATEAGVSAKMEYCFEANTGYLQRLRRLKTGTARGANDIVEVMTRDGAGETTREQLYGGDLIGVGTGELCALALGADSHRLDHTYQLGVRSTTQAIRADGTAISFFSLNQLVDFGSGLVKRVTEGSGLRTDYEYDTSGRMTWIKPQGGHDGWVQLTHVNATAGTPIAKTRVWARPNGSSTAVLAEGLVEYDGFGQVKREGKVLPGGVWAYQDRSWTAQGWPSWISTLYTTNPVFWTKNQQYDPFGRPRRIRQADSSPANPAHDINITYSGVRLMTMRGKVGTGRDAATGTILETDSTTTYVYDRQGRIRQVTEPSGAAGALVTTTYTHDIGNRLTQAVTPSGATTQTRSWVYDNLGFLRTESLPEYGSAATFSNYDPTGNAGRRTQGGESVDFVYDRAERLTTVKEPGATGRVFKSFVYHTSNPAGTFSNGKLSMSERHHYVLLGGTSYDVVVRELYSYAGRGGRVSSRVTENDIYNLSAGTGGLTDRFSQGWTWDELGKLSRLDYPNAQCGACPPNQPRAVDFTYTSGLLTGVTGYTGTVAGQTAGIGITYHPSGLVAQVAHGNGVNWVQAVDPFGLPRSGGISTTNAVSNWNTGAYAWDGFANLVKMGTSWFLHDSVHRVTTATVFDGVTGGGAQKQQTYGFDAFGNIQSIGGINSRSTTTSQSTNRLTGAVSYDTSGNLTGWNGNTYDFGPLDEVTRTVTGGQEWLHFYTAEGQRLWSYEVGGGNKNRWTLRGLDGQVLREYSYDKATLVWRVENDYIYRDSVLLASETPAGRVHLHVDHLGSPRLITNASRQTVAYHVYFPFGEEATAFNLDTQRAKFTAHERDLNSLAGWMDDLDYMRARFASPVNGRFLSVDPADFNPVAPQTLNRYAYVAGRAMTTTDPYGLMGCTQGGPNHVDCSDSINVSSRPNDSSDFNPNTGLSGLNSLLWGSAFFNNLSNMGGDILRGFEDFELRRAAMLSGKGFLAYVDGFLPFFDPFEAMGAYDSNDQANSILKVGGEVASYAVAGTAAVKGTKFAVQGREIAAKSGNWRIAPGGNRTGHPTGRFPHYHRRARGPNGDTLPGGSIKRHRPWDTRSTDKSFWDRF